MTSLGRSLSEMLHEGTTLKDALRLLATVARTEEMRQWLQEATKEAAEGRPLSAAMEKGQHLFSPLWIRAIQAAELRDEVPAALRRLSRGESEKRWRQQHVRRAAVVPAVMAAIFLCATGVLLGGLIPRLAPIFRTFSIQLPVPSAAVLAAGEWLRRSWGAMLSWCALAVLLAYLFAHTDEGKGIVRRWRLRLPIFGTLARWSMVSEFCESLATLIHVGCPLGEAYELALPRTMGFDAPREITDDTKLSDAIECSEGFPRDAVQAIRCGESIGRLEPALAMYAEVLRSRIEALASRVVAVSYAAALAASVIVVVALVVTMFLPAFAL